MVLRGKPVLGRGNSLCKRPELVVFLVNTHEAGRGGHHE